MGTSKYRCVVSGRSVGVGVWGEPWLLIDKDWVELLSSQIFNQHCFEPLTNDSRARGGKRAVPPVSVVDALRVMG